jgi:hypothetical protein
VISIVDNARNAILNNNTILALSYLNSAEQQLLALLGINANASLNSFSSLSNGNNATKPDTNDIGTIPTVNPDEPSFLKVIVNVINTGGGTASPGDFDITIYGNNPHPSSFKGSQAGTISTMGGGKYSVSVSQGSDDVPYGTKYSGDCALNQGLYTNLGYGGGSLAPGEKNTCTVTMIYPNF